MNYDIKEHDPKRITAWFEKQPEVVSVGTPNLVRNNRKKPIFKGKELRNNAQFREHPGNSLGQDKLHILEGGTTPYPNPGEIWIPNHWKSKSDINLGDTLFFPIPSGLFPLTVSGIVINAQNANGLGNPIPVWVGPGTLPMLYPISELSNVSMGIRLKNSDDTELFIKKYSKLFMK